MGEVIVDTNVPLMADGGDMSLVCQGSCAEFIEAVIRGKYTMVIDDQWHIIGEYENKMPKQTQESWSRKFLKHIYSNQGNPRRVKQVGITSLGENDFEEFPESLRKVGFDMSDRKFVAVAIANNGKAPIAQAADSKWIGWEKALNEAGVKVLFLCKDELSGKYQQKMG